MSKCQWMSAEAREAELFKLLAASLQQRQESVPENLNFLLGGRHHLECTQIGIEEGFVNYIYRVKEKEKSPSGGQSVVIKWARVVHRAAEEKEMEMDMKKFASEQNVNEHAMLQRNTRESEVLERVGKDLIPGSTPEVYWVDPQRYFFIMEDLADYETLRQRLTNGKVSSEVFLTISRMLATLHKGTHINTLGKEEFDKFSASIPQSPMIEGIANFMFEGFKWENDFVEIKKEKERVFSDSMKKLLPEIYDNEECVSAMKPLKESYLNRKLCYLHNDTHPGAFMVNDAGDVRILDMEFTSMGNPAKEVGHTLGEVIMFYYVYQGRDESQLCGKVREATAEFITNYLQHMGDLVNDTTTFMQYVAGHAGHFVCLRVANLFMTFPPLDGMEKAEADCLRAGTALLKHWQDVTSLEKILSSAFL